MKLHLLAITSAVILTTGCASDTATMAQPSSTTTAIEQAKADLSVAKAHSGEWKIIDPSTGSEAQDLSKLLTVAEKKAAEGDTQEAERIAARISRFSKLGVEQSLKYEGSAPIYQ